MPKNNTRSKKFEPKFHPTAIQVTEVGDCGLLAVNPTKGRTFQCHKNDVKLLMHQEESRVNPQDFPEELKGLEHTMQQGNSYQHHKKEDCLSVSWRKITQISQVTQISQISQIAKLASVPGSEADEN